MIKLYNAEKKIDRSVILKNISFTIERGSIFGLIGPNGAGKTSLIKILTGIWDNDSGSVKVKGMKVFDNPEVKRTIAYVPDYSHYYPSFKGSEILKFYKLAYPSFDHDRFRELNNKFRIPLSKRIGILSKGQKTALALILNLSVMPEILIMDEPASGLDPIAKRKFVEIILDEVAQRQTTVIISTHNLQDIEQICDTIAVINNGEIINFGSTDYIKKGYKKIQAVFNNAPESGIFRNSDILYSSNLGNIYSFIVKNNSSEFEEMLKNEGAFEIKELDLSLEEMFIYSLGGECSDFQNAK